MRLAGYCQMLGTVTQLACAIEVKLETLMEVLKKDVKKFTGE